MDPSNPTQQLQLPVNFPAVQTELNEEHRNEALSRAHFRTQEDRDSVTVSRGRVNPDFASVTTSRHNLQAWDVSHVSQKLLRQILGLNPFKTSYCSLYRTLGKKREKCLLFAGVALAIAAGAPLPIM
jgi:hypothetical protein